MTMINVKLHSTKNITGLNEVQKIKDDKKTIRQLASYTTN